MDTPLKKCYVLLDRSIVEKYLLEHEASSEQDEEIEDSEYDSDSRINEVSSTSNFAAEYCDFEIDYNILGLKEEAIDNDECNIEINDSNYESNVPNIPDNINVTTPNQEISSSLLNEEIATIPSSSSLSNLEITSSSVQINVTPIEDIIPSTSSTEINEPTVIECLFDTCVIKTEKITEDEDTDKSYLIYNHIIYKCSMCTYDTNDIKNYIEHCKSALIHQNNLFFPCLYCNSYFEFIDDFKKHLAYRHFICILCYSQLLTCENFNQHIIEHHYKHIYYYPCKICDTVEITNSKALLLHYYTKHTENVDDIKNPMNVFEMMRFNDKMLCKRFSPNNNNYLPCFYCNSFIKASLMSIHLKYHNIKACNLCNRYIHFNNNIRFKKCNYCECINVRNETDLLELDITKEYTICNTCNSCNLNNTIHICDSILTEIKCGNCHIIFKNNKDLFSHRNCKHLDDENFKYINNISSNYCTDMDYKQKYYIFVKNDSNKYKCEVCYGEFHDSNDFYLHMLSEKMQLDYPCIKCNFNTKSLNAYKKHLILTHFICVFCDLELYNNENFDLHISQHKEHKWCYYQCSKCIKFFRTRNLLKNHFKIDHSTCLTDVNDINSMLKIEICFNNMSHDEIICYYCNGCIKFSRREQHLKHHNIIPCKFCQKFIHYDEKNMQCRKCIYCNCINTSKDNLIQLDNVNIMNGYECKYCFEFIMDKNNHKCTCAESSETRVIILPSFSLLTITSN